MKNTLSSLIFIFLLLGIGRAQDSARIVLVETSLGNIKLKLYNETPKHRDNFIKLVESHFYDSLLFHRVINTFMIQGGDPTSKNALPDKILGEGDIGYTIPAEFNQKLFHKRGALAAARNGDDVNPEQASSGCQFYIVQGKIFTDSLLSLMEKRIIGMKAYNNMVKRPENKMLFDKFNQFQQMGIMDSVVAIKNKIDQLSATEASTIAPYKFSDEQRKAYTTIGGAPHLDGSYTVFGEVIEGMDVVDKIASTPKNRFDRPLTNVVMKMSILK